MRYLFFDTMTKSFSLEDKTSSEEKVIFLGPFSHTLLKLQNDFGLSAGQARDAVLTAYDWRGAPVCIDKLKKIGSSTTYFIEKK